MFDPSTRLSPKPQVFKPLPGSCSLDGLNILVSEDLKRIQTALFRFEDQLRQLGIPLVNPTSSSQCNLELALVAHTIRGPESYLLTVTQSGMCIQAEDETGLFRGLTSLLQWIRIYKERGKGSLVGCVHLEDWADFKNRGVMLDVSRNKIPTMATLLNLIDRLSEWKINQIQLYTEHSFAYSCHPSVWAGYSPITAAEVVALDRYCCERFIELVPNQNSFGHFHRWLVHPSYRPLAECPEGVVHAFSLEVEPFSLCPADARVIPFLCGLYDELLPNFSSNQLNVGLDETFDLGMGGSREVCREKGKGRVYVAFLKKIHEQISLRGYRMQFWGDIVLNHPHLISALPEGVTALVWGYEAGHPFAVQCAQFAETGMPFYVCPGTSSWNSIGGRWDNALENLADAAVQGKSHGAEGFLITDWGDNGHLQPLLISYPGLLAGACFSWNASQAKHPASLDLEGCLNTHVFGDSSGEMGGLLRELGNVYQQVGDLPANGSNLFFLMRYADQTLDHERLKGITLEGLERATNSLKKITKNLPRSASGELGFAAREMQWACGFLLWLARFGTIWLTFTKNGAVVEIPIRQRQNLAAEIPPICCELKQIWLLRNRPGGFHKTRARFQYLQDAILGETGP